jgi:hypothetical protein
MKINYLKAGNRYTFTESEDFCLCFSKVYRTQKKETEYAGTSHPSGI